MYTVDQNRSTTPSGVTSHAPALMTSSSYASAIVTPREDYMDCPNDVEDDNRLVIDEKEEECCVRERQHCEEERSSETVAAMNVNNYLIAEAKGRCIDGVEMTRLDVSKYTDNNEASIYDIYLLNNKHSAANSLAYFAQKMTSENISKTVNLDYTAKGVNTKSCVGQVALRPTQLIAEAFPLDRTQFNRRQVHRMQSTEDDPDEDDELATDTHSQVRYPPVTVQHPSPLSETIAEETSENFFHSPRHTGDYEQSTGKEFLVGFMDDLQKQGSQSVRSVVRNDYSKWVTSQFSQFQNGIGQYRYNIGSISGTNGFDVEENYQKSDLFNDGEVLNRETITLSPELTENENSLRLGTTTSGGQNSLYSCHLCEHVGETKAEYTLHMRSVHFRNRCSFCGYSSRTLGRLKRHVMDFHSSPNEGGKAAADKTKMKRRKKHTCRDCTFITEDQTEYWVHIRTHIPEDKQLLCTRCSFVTSCKHHMEYHLRNHVGSKPYKCERCNYQCINKAMLKSHMKSHDNFYPYRCANCTYAAKYLHALNMHLKKTGHVVQAQPTSNPPVVRSSAKVNTSIRKPAVNQKSLAIKKLVKNAISRTSNADKIDGMPSLTAIRSNVPVDIQSGFTAEFNSQSFHQQSQSQPPPSQSSCMNSKRENESIRYDSNSLSEVSPKYGRATWPRSALEQLHYRPSHPRSSHTNNIPGQGLRPIPVAYSSSSSSLNDSNKSNPYSACFAGNNDAYRSRTEKESLHLHEIVNPVKIEVKSPGAEQIEQIVTPETIALTTEDDVNLHRWNKKRRLPLCKEMHVKKVNVTDGSLIFGQSETSVAVQNKHSQVPLDLSVGKNCENNELCNQTRDVTSFLSSSVGVPDSYAMNEALVTTNLMREDIDAVSSKKNRNFFSRIQTPSKETTDNQHSVIDQFLKYKSSMSEAQQAQSLIECDPFHRNQFTHLVGRGMYAPVDTNNHRCHKIPRNELEQDRSSHEQSPMSATQYVKEQNTSESFECTHCGIIFTDYVLHAFHMSFHSRDDPFRCNKCCFETSNNREFFIHIGRVAHSG